MDATPIQSLAPSSSKLPIKRKFPGDHESFLTPKHEQQSLTTAVFHDDLNAAVPSTARHQPCKFHRVWTEPDEIRFLQALIQSGDLSFPRDLAVFYSRFTSISQHYTKSQLSDKIRRLRKKYRVTSSRLATGLHPSALSSHDLALFDLSNKLWSPEFSATSPFGKTPSTFDSAIHVNQSNKMIHSDASANLVGVKVHFSPVLLKEINYRDSYADTTHCDNFIGDSYVRDCFPDEEKRSKVNLDFDSKEERHEIARESNRNGADIVGIVVSSVLNVLNDCLNDVRMGLMRQKVISPVMKEGKEKDFDRRLGEQRVAEFDVLSQRLRLVIQNPINKK